MIPTQTNLLLAGAARVREAIASVTHNVNNTTGSKVIYTVTGSVLVHAIWGEVTTVLSSNQTAAFLRTDDQTAQIDVTLATGVTISSLAVGSLLLRTGQVDVALIAKSVAAGFFVDGGGDWLDLFTPFAVGKKTAAVTTIDLRYTTTNTPSTGVTRWHALWSPLSSDGNLA